MSESKITVAIIAGVIVLLCAFAFVYQVRPTDVVVHYRPPGKVFRIYNEEEKDETGLKFRLPYPIDEVKRYDRRVRVLDGPLGQTQLRDEWQVTISSYAGWKISEPVAFEESLRGDIDEAERRLKDVLFNETSSAVSTLEFNDLVHLPSEAKGTIELDALEEQIAEEARNSIADRGYGLQLVSFGIRRIAIPESTTKEVIKRMQAEREKIAEKYRAEGRSEKAAIIARAQKDAEKILADAESEAKQIRSKGEAAEAKYYDIFAKEPDLAIFLRRLEALRTIARRAREEGTPITFVLDTRTEPLSVLRQGPQALEKMRQELEAQDGPEQKETATEDKE